MKTVWIPLLACTLACPLMPGQLAPDQKVADFRVLAAIYSKRYGPYQWKKTLFNFDLLNLAPWLSRVTATNNDLDFYELMVEYVADLNDTHDAYLLPASFTASLGLNVDIYDGKVLIDGINRAQLPPLAYPFAIGDELVSVDGTAAADLLSAYAKYYRQANPRSTARRAASLITLRQQSRMPHAAAIGDQAAVMIRRQTGALENYTITWAKAGLPLTSIDPVPSPTGRVGRNPHKSSTSSPSVPLPFDPAQPMPDLGGLEYSGEDAGTGVLGYAARAPIFLLPTNFSVRLGRNAADYFYSGTFTSAGRTLGFIRIPTYDPADLTAALQQFAAEIAYFQTNTDGLIVDEMRNNGGQLCYGESILTYLMPSTFRPLGYEIRATWEYLNLFAQRLASAKAGNAPQPLIDQYQAIFNAVQAAYTANRGNTDAVPLCTASFDRSPARDANGAVAAYTKPIVMLIDEFSLSTADSVPAMFQDNKRGLLVGWRSNGAGGSNSLNTQRWQVGAYSEGDTGVTLSLMVRKDVVVTSDYPPTKYVENVGVRPEVILDYMTLDNLLHGGATFFSAVTDAMVKLIAGN